MDNLRSRVSTVAEGVASVAGGVGALFFAANDIVGALEKDHDALRDFIKVLKDPERPMTERRRAFAGFAPLLKSHSDSEEKAVYLPAKKLVGKEIHIKVAEGFAEHQVADDLLKRLSRARDTLNWSALANVLAEIVEHHLDEEEEELFPKIRKTASPQMNARMLKQFVTLRKRSQSRVSKKNAGVLKGGR